MLQMRVEKQSMLFGGLFSSGRKTTTTSTAFFPSKSCFKPHSRVFDCFLSFMTPRAIEHSLPSATGKVFIKFSNKVIEHSVLGVCNAMVIT